MPLTDEQREELNGHVKELPVIVELHQDMDSLKEGQEEIMSEFQKHEAENKRQFKHGAEIMVGLKEDIEKNRTEIEAVSKKVDDMERNITKLITEQHNELKNEIRDDKLRELSTRLEKAEAGKQKAEEKNESRVWQIVTAVLTVIIVSGLSYIGISKQ